MRRMLAGLVLVVGLGITGVGLALPATAHDITVTPTGVCTEATSATITFNFTSFGSEHRFIKIYLGGNLVGDFENLGGDGTHVLTLTNLPPDTDSVTLTWDTDAVTPNGKPSITVDLTPCQPTTTTATTLVTTTAPCDTSNGRECETTTTATTLATTTTTGGCTEDCETTTTAKQTTTTGPLCVGLCAGQFETTTTATTLATTTTATTLATTTTAATTTGPPRAALPAEDTTVAAPPPSQPPSITPTTPVTGADSGSLVAVGLGLVAAGVGGMFLARRKVTA